MSQPLLDVEDLAIGFKTGPSFSAATRGVNLCLNAGETLALVGESGSGKSVTALALMGLLPRSAQVTFRKMKFEGQDLSQYQAADWRHLRGPGIAMVFQDPMTSLNPLMRCGEQVAEGIRLHRKISETEARKETLHWFEAMDLPEPERRYRAFPFEMSGGQRQRVMIAMALACKPKLLIADEPTTALDVTVQAQILKLLKRAQADQGMALLLITHDLGIVRDSVERVQVMYAGNVVESGPVEAVLNAPRHPYTQGLLDSIPNPDKPLARLKAIEGVVPAAGENVLGCRFHPRCSFAETSCRTGEMPTLQRVVNAGDETVSRYTACPVALANSRWQAGSLT